MNEDLRRSLLMTLSLSLFMLLICAVLSLVALIMGAPRWFYPALLLGLLGLAVVDVWTKISMYRAGELHEWLEWMERVEADLKDK